MSGGKAQSNVFKNLIWGVWLTLRHLHYKVLTTNKDSLQRSRKSLLSPMWRIITVTSRSQWPMDHTLLGLAAHFDILHHSWPPTCAKRYPHKIISKSINRFGKLLQPASVYCVRHLKGSFMCSGVWGCGIVEWRTDWKEKFDLNHWSCRRWLLMEF